MNPWIEHVRTFAANHQLSFACAVSNPKCKDAYLKTHPLPDTIVDETQDLTALSDIDIRRFKAAFKAILKENGVLRRRLSPAAIEKFADMAQNRALKPTSSTVMKWLNTILEKADRADFKIKLASGLKRVGYDYAGSVLDLVNELLEARAYTPLTEQQWNDL